MSGPTKLMIAVLAFLFLVPLARAVAQTDGPLDEVKAALAEFEKEYTTAKAQLDAKLKVVRESEEYQQARKNRDWEGTKAMTDEFVVPFWDEWKARGRKLMEPHADRPGELVIAAFLLEEHYFVEDQAAFLARLIETHVKSEHLGIIRKYFRGLYRGLSTERRNGLLQMVIDHNPVAETKAYAHHTRAQFLSRRGASEEEKQQAAADRKAVLELLPADHLLVLRARGPEFEKTRLQIGMEAPEIVGTDLNGKPMKLSDFRGQVVVLDFWGDW